MNKKEEFRNFVKTKPELINHIKNGSMTWQKYYEIYDIYGDNIDAWSKYTKEEVSSSTREIPSKLSEIMKSVNMDSIQEHISTAQKALGFVQELAGTGKTPTAAPKGPTVPRPINKFFED